MKNNELFFANEVKEYNFLDSKYYQFRGRSYLLPFETFPTEGKHNFKVCKNCVKGRSIVEKNLTKDFLQFPNCCKNHSKLKSFYLFNKSDFEGVSIMIADKIYFTYHHIINKIEDDNWYLDIFDYVQHTLKSFGEFPVGFGEPYKQSFYCNEVVGLLVDIEKEIKEKTKESIEIKTRINKIINLFNPIDTEIENKNQDLNLEILFKTYEEWYKTFPFDILYFSKLKEKYKKTLPLFTGRERINKYSRTQIKEIHNFESLLVTLLQITQNIISTIDLNSLLKDGIIDDLNYHELQIAISNRKIEVFELSKLPNTVKYEYIEILKLWLEGEKAFITIIKPLSVNKKTNFNRPNRTDLAYEIYYLSQTKTLKLNFPFPSDKAWIEIDNRYGKNAKNIQIIYNSIVANQKERLKKSRIGNIKYVVENRLKEYPEALNLAEDELKLAELNS